MKMINQSVRQKILVKLTEKFGKLRYPKDYERLSMEIQRETKAEVSRSTLYRLINGPTVPRLSTLDVISKYLGYSDWDELAPDVLEKE